MSDDTRPSIAELEAIFAKAHALTRAEVIAIKDAAPALIAIARAAMAFREQRDRNLYDGIMRPEAVSQEERGSRVKLTMELEVALADALKAVRP